MARTELFVIIEGMPAGILRQDSTGQIYFRYADGYRGTPLSLSLPVTLRDKALAEVLGRHGLTESVCLECMARLARCIPSAMEQVFEENILVPGMDELCTHLLEPVKKDCARTLDLL